MANNRHICIGVIGAGRCSRRLADQAYAVGKAIAEKQAVLVCGGLGGIMEAAARGAKEAGGTTIGIIPGNDKTDANAYIDHVIPTGMGEARNVLVVRSSDALISLHGKYGTISEMALALKMNKPLISLFAWDVFPEVIHIPDPNEAVLKAVEQASHG